MNLLPASAQELRYDVVRSGKSMGETVVDRKVTAGETIFYLSTKTTFRVLFSFDVQYDILETFKGSVLQSGTSFNTLNGSMQKETSLAKGTGYYDLIIDGITTKIHEDQIKDSVSEIYFEEPHHDKKLFSAYFGRFLSVVKVGEHEYSLTSPDGINVYTYLNGICTEVKVSRDFANFSLVLKPEFLKAVKEKKLQPNTP